MAKKKNNNFYVDGFLLVVSEKNLPAYKKMATMGKKVWMKHGALDYKECIQDDMNPDSGGMKIMNFPKLVKAKKGELVIFSYILFKSKKDRDQINAKVMKDAEMNDPKYKDMPMPFDMKRMSYGGFKTIVSA